MFVMDMVSATFDFVHVFDFVLLAVKLYDCVKLMGVEWENLLGVLVKAVIVPDKIFIPYS